MQHLPESEKERKKKIFSGGTLKNDVYLKQNPTSLL